MQFIWAILILFFGMSSVFAFDSRNLDDAIEMAELSLMMNGDGSAAMGTPRDLKDYGRWKLIAEGLDKITPYYGFSKYGNRWAAFRSTREGENNTYAIVVRGTIEDAASIVLDALALTAQGKYVWFRDNDHHDKGHLIQLADNENASVHMGFAVGLVDILFHKDSQGLLGFLQGLDDNSTLYLTGHSQGAGIATLLHSFLLHRKDLLNQGYRLGSKNFKVSSYVFAQPKPGDWHFAMDFSRALYKANDGSVAYVINNVWDWVPQAPLSVQWPTEFTGRLLDSYSGSQNLAVEQVLKFAANYSNVEAALRSGLTKALMGIEANRNDIEGMKKSLLSVSSKYITQYTLYMGNLAEKPEFPHLMTIVWRDPSQGPFNDMGVFKGDLASAYFNNLKQPEGELYFHAASSINYMPVGNLISLPPTAKSAAAKDDLTLQHHMRLYRDGLEAMKRDLP